MIFEPPTIRKGGAERELPPLITASVFNVFQDLEKLLFNSFCVNSSMVIPPTSHPAMVEGEPPHQLSHTLKVSYQLFARIMSTLESPEWVLDNLESWVPAPREGSSEFKDL